MNFSNRRKIGDVAWQNVIMRHKSKQMKLVWEKRLFNARFKHDKRQQS